jgi:hypothetical protein
MAEEPQPTALQEGASNPHAPTSTAEDRKAAAALSSLDTQDEDAAGGKKGKDVDTRALNEAMAKVSVEESKGETKKQIKVQPKSTDVALLVCTATYIRPSEFRSWLPWERGYTVVLRIRLTRFHR